MTSNTIPQTGGWPSQTKLYRIQALEIALAKLDTDIATLTATVSALQTVVATTVTALQGIQATATADAADDVAVLAANATLNTLITNLKAVLPK